MKQKYSTLNNIFYDNIIETGNKKILEIDEIITLSPADLRQIILAEHSKAQTSESVKWIGGDQNV